MNIDKIYLTKMPKSSGFFILFLFISVAGAYGQETWENESELKDVEIEIVKDREIVLPKASRNFEKIPPTTFQDNQSGMEYFFSTIPLPMPLLDVRMRPLRVKDATLEKTYGNYVRAGIGNYATTYLEAYLNSKRNTDYSYGAHVNWLNQGRGPVNGSSSASGDFDIDLFGKYFTPGLTFSGDAGINSTSERFYGVPDLGEADTEKQAYQNFYLKGMLENTDKDSPVQYDLGLRFDAMQDKREASETEFQAFGEAQGTITEGFDLILKSDLSLIGRKDEMLEKFSRTLFRVKPSVKFEYEGFRIRAGVNAVYENDTIEGFNKLHLYPDAETSYTFSDKMDLFAGVTGDIKKNTLHTIAGENPWIAANQPINHSNMTIKFFGGVRGKVTPELGFEAGISVANYKNMYFFLNDTLQQEEFNLLYDRGNTALVNLYGSLGYTKAEEWSVHVRGDYYGYGTSDIGEAWHKPNYRLAATASYNLYDKIRFSGEAYALGGLKSYDFTTNEVVNLTPAFDLNLMAEYLFSSRVSAFIQANNIFSKEYEVFYRYPSRGFQFMVGASYTF